MSEILTTTNPFNSEEIKRTILEKEGLVDQTSSPQVLVEDPVEDATIDEDFDNEPGTVINPQTAASIVSNSYRSISKDAQVIIHDATSITTRDKIEKSKEVSAALNRVFTEYNSKYGLSLKFDFTSLSQSLLYITDKKNFRTLELFVSETFGRFRALIMVKVLQSIAILADDILDPKRLLSNEVEYTDKFLVVEKLLTYVDMIEKLYAQVKIVGADTELAKLKDETEGVSEAGMTNEEMKKFLDLVLAQNDIKTVESENKD